MIDEEVIAAAYDEIAPRLMNYLVANGVCQANAADIVQETFLRIWRKRDTLRGDSLSGLAFAIARNLKIDFFRRNRFFVSQEELRVADPEEAAVPEAQPPSDDLIYLRRRLIEALARLPEELREAYTMAQIGGMPVAEMAQNLNISPNLVKVRVHRARKKLRPLLADLKNF